MKRKIEKFIVNQWTATQFIIIILLIMLCLLAMIARGCGDNDEQTQRREAEEGQRNTLLQQEGGELYGQDGAGSGGLIAGIGIYEVRIAGFTERGFNTAADHGRYDTRELQKLRDNERQQTTRSLALPSPGASTGGDADADSGSDSIYDAVGIKYKITQYTAGYESTGKHPGDKTYGMTYSGAMVQENHTIAADPDVLPIGTVVQIEGLDGTYVVEDTGSAVNGKHIDVYTEDVEDALDWGVQYRRIIVIEEGGAELGP